MTAVIQAIRAKYPGTRVVVEPYGDPDGDRSIRWWLQVMNVNPSEMGPLQRFAGRLADDLYAPAPRPFFMGMLTRRQTTTYLARRAAMARWAPTRHRRWARHLAALRRAGKVWRLPVRER